MNGIQPIEQRQQPLIDQTILEMTTTDGIAREDRDGEKEKLTIESPRRITAAAEADTLLIQTLADDTRAEEESGRLRERERERSGEEAGGGGLPLYRTQGESGNVTKSSQRRRSLYLRTDSVNLNRPGPANATNKSVTSAGSSYLGQLSVLSFLVFVFPVPPKSNQHSIFH